MPQSASSQFANAGFHVGIIMDGNGRWATRRGLPRVAGHQAGADAVRRAVDAAPGLGIDTLTLFAFSADNWERPRGEVEALMRIFEDYLAGGRAHFIAQRVSVSVIGRRDRFSQSLLHAAEVAESSTAGGTRMSLRIAIDYSGREAIVEAARHVDGPSDAHEFSRRLAEAIRASDRPLDIDLLIRTGGEHRLSDLPLWEIAYAELCFSPCMWPDFTAEDFEAAVTDFHSRERRFGRIPEQITA